MTVQRFWSLIRKQWRILAVCFLAVGGGAFGVSKVLKPVYASSAIVQVSIQSASGVLDLNSLQASGQMVQTDAQLAVSYPVLQTVAGHYQGLTESALAKEVTGVPRLNTQLFEINVQDKDPRRAARLANDVAETLIAQQATASNQSTLDRQARVQQDLTTTNGQINALITQIDDAQGKDPTKVAVLQTQLTLLQQRYTQWQTLLGQLELAQAESGDMLQVVQAAEPSSSPVRPNVLMNTGAGLLVGLFLGILLALLLEELDTHAHTADDVKELLEWPIAGTIWRTNGQAFNPQSHDLNAEAYRILRTNVGFSGIDRPLRTLIVTSTVPGEGKSTVAANLALFMARSGKNTLLVDADMRRPTQQALFHIPADKPGLSNAVLALGQELAGPLAESNARAALESYFHYSGYPGLKVMPAGPLPPNPSELLDSKAMQRLITFLTGSGADMIIFDAPPAIGISDAGILAAKVDGALVVVDPTMPTRSQIKQMKATLQQSGARVVGCVVNKIRPTRQDTASSAYYTSPSPQKRGAFSGNEALSPVASSAVPTSQGKGAIFQHGSNIVPSSHEK